MPPADSLNDEIEKSLADINLQELDLPDPRSSAKKGGGDLKTGVIEGISGTDVFVELGPRLQGVISIDEFDEEPKPGDSFEFSTHGMDKDGLWRLSRRQARVVAAYNDLYEGAQVKAIVTGHNSGGLELSIGPVSAFMPASHVDLARVEDLSTFVGQNVMAVVLELDMSKKRVVLSRKKAMLVERDEAREETMRSIQAGDVKAGKVVRLEPFGAFVDIGGVEGLVHISNISRKRVEDINDALKVGQDVRVMVLELKEGGKKIGLGMKQLEEDPWDTLTHRYQIDQVVPGKVVRLMDFGAFVEIEDGVEGLLHISQIGAKTRLNKAGDALSVGEEVSVRIQSIDPSAERISLSRLDTRGALIGSEDSVAAEDIDRALGGGGENAGKLNLGDLFKKALGD
jgi:small subunit ribosomal protein S1